MKRYTLTLPDAWDVGSTDLFDAILTTLGVPGESYTLANGTAHLVHHAGNDLIELRAE